MRKIMAIGLAGALATASVGATSQSAQASVAGAVVVGVAIGVGVLLLLHHHPFYTTQGYATLSYAPVPNGHTAWCESNYRTYNVVTDSFHGYDGYDHKCISPAY